MIVSAHKILPKSITAKKISLGTKPPRAKPGRKRTGPPAHVRRGGAVFTGISGKGHLGRWSEESDPSDTRPPPCLHRRLSGCGWGRRTRAVNRHVWVGIPVHLGGWWGPYTASTRVGRAVESMRHVETFLGEQGSRSLFRR